ncbi:MAG: His/Gly/Thr/Pro-type tRNA ligase C-terminal domain-containing protein [Candidatus Aenigmatarchaeota archaeon]
MLPEETPHYSKGNFDLEIEFDFGFKEVVGNAYRGDYDLSSHAKLSGEDFSIVEDGNKVIPHVVEPSFGIDRTIHAVLLHCFVEDKKRGWDWFRFPPRIAPYSVAVFPLVSKDSLPEKAKEVFTQLKNCFDVFYDESGSIGKRYARSDEIGIPFAITIDYQTLKDNTVTIRSRDTTEQVRTKIEDLASVIWKLVYEEKDLKN